MRFRPESAASPGSRPRLPKEARSTPPTGRSMPAWTRTVQSRREGYEMPQTCEHPRYGHCSCSQYPHTHLTCFLSTVATPSTTIRNCVTSSSTGNLSTGVPDKCGANQRQRTSPNARRHWKNQQSRLVSTSQWEAATKAKQHAPRVKTTACASHRCILSTTRAARDDGGCTQAHTHTQPHTQPHTHTQRQYEHVFNTTQCVCV